MEFPWLPIGTALGRDAASGRVLRAGSGWQLLATDTPGATALLLDPDAPDAAPWWADEVAALQEVLACETTTDGARTFCSCLIESVPGARTLGDLALRNSSIGPEELCCLLDGIESLRERHSNAGWEAALFIPGAGFLLGTREDPAEDRRAVITALLSGGVRDPALTPARIRQFNSHLTEVEIDQALRRLGLAPGTSRRAAFVRPPEEFALPAQPQLEKVLREHVIDVVYRADDYTKLGVKPPNGILLKGPTGTGKSHAARELSEFLGWPVFDLDLASIGTSLLHETSRRIAEVFAKAETAAPAIVLLEEVDALGGARDRTHGAGVEEVNTLLRQVENASARAILVIGTTNRPEALDPALLRRGRFDLSIAVDKLDVARARAMLDGLLGERPSAVGLDVAAIAARLAGRPASDLAWVVEEAARLAVRSGKHAIDEICLARALRNLS
jgi:ATPase family protein associated with various cellular activities (AAA)